MKNIGILTWLHNENYGSILQAYALQNFLRLNGYNVEDIDYNPTSFERLKNWVISKNSPDLFIDKFNRKFKEKECHNKQLLNIRRKKFEIFKKENMIITERYSNNNELKSTLEKYDTFICGSDQIWSPRLMNPVFYLNFVPNEKNKISYAPSFGVINLNKNKKILIKKLLKDFKYISVREEQGKELIKEITEREVEVNLDPTLLLSKDEWEKILTNNQKNEEKYIFCYFLKDNYEYIRFVKKYAEIKKMKVIIVPTTIGPFNTTFEEHIDCGPDEWIELIKNAQIVFTDSFHGCVFSTIFHKDFVAFKRFSDGDKKSENSRLYNFTKMLKLENRIIEYTDFSKIQELKPINYENIDEILKEKTLNSKNWLLNSIGK